ncbi:hypothetical protein ACTFIY_007504 [Dictyostelium cf. discoideum]
MIYYFLNEEDLEPKLKLFINKLSKLPILNNQNPLITNLELIQREITIDLFYKIISFDIESNRFIKKNKGSSIGSIINNNIFCKIDIGSRLLRPAKENAVFQLYYNLYPLNNKQSSSSFISPTELNVINNLPSNIVSQENIFIQCSLLVNGKSFDSFLENKSNYNNEIQLLDDESYCSHILSSLLLMTTDYKGDNIFIENNINKIIGIDNDECMEFDELNNSASNRKTYINFKNILFTFKSRMSKVVNENIINQFIQHQPNIFILNWLNQIYQESIKYEKFIEFSCLNKFEILRTNESLQLPIKFKKGWILKMLNRFKRIIEILKRDKDDSDNYNKSITYYQLFKEILPTTYYYYQGLLLEETNHPLDQMESLYFEENRLSVEEMFQKVKHLNETHIKKLLQEIKNTPKNNEEVDLSIIETIKELIKGSELNDFKSDKDLIDWMETIVKLNETLNIDIELNETFYNSYQLILEKVLKLSSPSSFHFIVKFIEITLNNSFRYNVDGEPILHLIIRLNVSYSVEFIDYFIKKLNIDVNIAYDELTALDLAANQKNFKLFRHLIKLGAGKNFNTTKISNYYTSLSHSQKIKFKPFLETLFHTNPNIAWCISLNQLLPLANSDDQDDGDENSNKIGRKILKTVFSGARRILLKPYEKSLFEDGKTPKKPNKYGRRSVPSISDDYGNCIYFKFSPQFPGTDFSVFKLSELLFPQDGGGGGCIPCCELASIDGDIAVLLIQNVFGETLFDTLEKEPEKVNKINSSNISKQLILSMLTNNGDGNLGNFIISHHKLDSPPKIYSIDNDQSFMPPISKPIKSGLFKSLASCKVSTVILLFNQMNDFVHQDVIDSIKNLDVDKLCLDWLQQLESFHQLSLLHFKSTHEKLKENKQTIIGVAFSSNMMKLLYSKLNRLKHHLNENNNNKPITHFQLYEKLEPLVASKIKRLIYYENLSIIDRYNKFNNITIKDYKNRTEILTKSSNPSALLLDSIDIPKGTDIQNELWSAIYGPDFALRELKNLKIKYSEIKNIIKSIESGDLNEIPDFHFENYLKKTNFLKKTKEKQKLLFQSIKERSDLRSIFIRNSGLLTYFYTIMPPNFNNLIEINFSNCINLIFICDYIGLLRVQLSLPSLQILNVCGCEKLYSIKLNCPNLITLLASNCLDLNEFDILAPNLKEINLKSSIKYSSIFNSLSRFGNLEKLDISNSRNLGSKLKFQFENLKYLKAVSIYQVSGFTFNLPNILSINIDDCKDLKEINSDRYHDWAWEALKANPSNKTFFQGDRNSINLKLCNVKPKQLPIVDQDYVILFDSKSYYIHSDNAIPGLHNFYNIKKQLTGNTIPPSVKSLTIHDGFNYPITKGIIPSTAKRLSLYRIKSDFELGAIPPTVTSLSLEAGFNLPLQPGFITNGVEYLSISEIQSELMDGSIPPSVSNLTLNNGFNQKIIKGMLSGELKYLDLKFILYPLKLGSIPSTVVGVTINGYNHSLKDGIIPYGVKTLTLHKMIEPLDSTCFPTSIKTIFIYDDFNQKLSKGVIPSGVTELYLHAFKEPLEIGSIPSTVKKISLYNGFKHPLDNKVLPEGIETLELYNTIHPLEKESIPKSLLKLEIKYSYNHIIPQDIRNQIKLNVKNNSRPTETNILFSLSCYLLLIFIFLIVTIFTIIKYVCIGFLIVLYVLYIFIMSVLINPIINYF